MIFFLMPSPKLWSYSLWPLPLVLLSAITIGSAGSSPPAALLQHYNESTPLAHTLFHHHELLNFFLNFSWLLAYFLLPFMSLARFTFRGNLTFLSLFLDPQAVLLYSSIAVSPSFQFFALCWQFSSWRSSLLRQASLLLKFLVWLPNRTICSLALNVFFKN